MYHLHLCEVKSHNAIQNIKRGGKRRSLLFCSHGRSLLIPTASTAILSKPKLTHFCPPGSESLSCLNFRHSWAPPSLDTMKRETYSLFVNSPVRRHDHCLSPLPLTILSQHLLSSGFMRCKVRKTPTVLSGRWSKKQPRKVLHLPPLSNLFLNGWEWHCS